MMAPVLCSNVLALVYVTVQLQSL